MSGLFGMLPGWITEWIQYAKDVENIEIDPKDIGLYVSKSKIGGEGGSKIAFYVDEEADENKKTEYCFTLPNDSAVSNFCLVEYKKTIEWIEETEELKKFKLLMQNDPVFKYNNDKYNDSKYNNIDQNDPEFGEYIKFRQFRELYKLYIKHEDQFRCIAELKKMYKMSDTHAPKLEKIKVDDVTHLDPDEHVPGIPFSPEDMDFEFRGLDSGSSIKISYLIERCDKSVVEIVFEDESKKDEVCAKIIEFIHSYVNTFNELNSDIKSENLCPTIVNGSVKLIRLLDVDPDFSIKCYGKDVTDKDIKLFNHHAENFIKYAFITHSVKIGDKVNGKRQTINFGNLGLTQHDVDEMIKYFYDEKYMVYDNNPNAVLYHYYVSDHPYNFLTDSPLPKGWIITQSKTTGKIYYANEITKQTQWDKPKHPYVFLSNDALMTYFKDVNMLIHLFKLLNKKYGLDIPIVKFPIKKANTVRPATSANRLARTSASASTRTSPRASASKSASASASTRTSPRASASTRTSPRASTSASARTSRSVIKASGLKDLNQVIGKRGGKPSKRTRKARTRKN